MQPVEVDIAVGIGGDRAAFKLEVMAQVDPYEFVAAMQECARALLSPQDPQGAVEDAPDPSGSGVERKAAAVRSRAAAADPPKVAKFDADAARARAAAAS